MSKGGIALVHETQDITRYNQYIFKLILHGPMAFKSPKLVGENGRFGHDAPKIGEWVLLNRLQGQEYSCLNDEGEPVVFRICPDDAIMVALDSPKGWQVGGVS